MSTVLLAILWGCAEPESSSVPVNPPTADSLAGLYTLELAPERDPFVAGDQSELHIVVTGEAGPTTSAALSLTPWMPDMGHGIAQAPEVVGDGDAYLATWVFSMPGYWELTIDIDAEHGADQAVVAYDVE